MEKHSSLHGLFVRKCCENRPGPLELQRGVLLHGPAYYLNDQQRIVALWRNGTNLIKKLTFWQIRLDRLNPASIFNVF